MGTTTSNTNLDGDDLDAIIQDMVLDDANSSTTMSANNSVNNDNDENYVEEETDQKRKEGPRRPALSGRRERSRPDVCKRWRN